MKKNLIILSVFMMIILSGCFSEINDKMEVITGHFESDLIEEQIYQVGLLTKVILIITEIDREEYNSVDVNRFIGWTDKGKYYEILLELTIDGKVVIKELLFKGRSSNMPDSYLFKTYFNSSYDSIRIVPTINKEITGYQMNLNASKTSIRSILLNYKNI